MQKASALHIATSVVLTTNLPTNEPGNNYLHALILTMTFDSLRKNNFIPEDWDLDSTNILDLHICEFFKLIVHSNTLTLSGRLAHRYIHIAPYKLQQNPFGSRQKSNQKTFNNMRISFQQSSTKDHSFKIIDKSIPVIAYLHMNHMMYGIGSSRMLDQLQLRTSQCPCSWMHRAHKFENHNSQHGPKNGLLHLYKWNKLELQQNALILIMTLYSLIA